MALESVEGREGEEEGGELLPETEKLLRFAKDSARFYPKVALLGHLGSQLRSSRAV